MRRRSAIGVIAAVALAGAVALLAIQAPVVRTVNEKILREYVGVYHC